MNKKEFESLKAGDIVICSNKGYISYGEERKFKCFSEKHDGCMIVIDSYGQECTIHHTHMSIKEKNKHQSEYNHYFKDVSHLNKIDIYSVLELFEVTNPCIQHAVKKLLCAGKRGSKDFNKDIQESIDTLLRLQEMTKDNESV